MPVEVDPPSNIAWDTREDWAQVLSHFVENGRTDFKPISTTHRGWVPFAAGILCNRWINQASSSSYNRVYYGWVHSSTHAHWQTTLTIQHVLLTNAIHDPSTLRRDAQHYYPHPVQAVHITFKICTIMAFPIYLHCRSEHSHILHCCNNIISPIPTHESSPLTYRYSDANLAVNHTACFLQRARGIILITALFKTRHQSGLNTPSHTTYLSSLL